MLSFTGRTKVYAATQAVDLRKSYDALFAYCRDVIKRDALSGHLFLFINKRRNRLKCLLWDGTGLVLICKRLEQGKFTLLNTLKGSTVALTSSEFALYFEGADLRGRFIVESPKKFVEFCE